jgi:hypothetical protein
VRRQGSRGACRPRRACPRSALRRDSRSGGSVVQAARLFSGSVGSAARSVQRLGRFSGSVGSVARSVREEGPSDNHTQRGQASSLLALSGHPSDRPPFGSLVWLFPLKGGRAKRAKILALSEEPRRAKESQKPTHREADSAPTNRASTPEPEPNEKACRPGLMAGPSDLDQLRIHPAGAWRWTCEQRRSLTAGPPDIDARQPTYRRDRILGPRHAGRARALGRQAPLRGLRPSRGGARRTHRGARRAGSSR